VVQLHEREQTPYLGVVGQQIGEQPGQTQRLAAQVGPDEVVAAAGRVALVEDQIHHLQDSAQARRQLGGRRDAVRNPRVGDLPLRPDETLAHGRLGDQERAGDLGRGQAAEGPQRQGDPGRLV
jgi:hypothetical protein